jgi:hypothetical protein
MTEKEEPGQLVGFEKMAQRILESFEKRMEQFILQAVKKSQGTHKSHSNIFFLTKKCILTESFSAFFWLVD